MHDEGTWLRPLWPAPAGVRALCSTRRGGVSGGAWRSWNLASHVGDDARAVQTNRARLQALVPRPVFLQQVHGCAVVELDETTVAETTVATGPVADACWSRTPRLACTILSADCLPVLMACCGPSVTPATPPATLVGAAHAGWRGLAAGVLEQLLAALRQNTTGASVVAWLGPCIGAQVFEVGADVYAAFVGPDPGAAQHFESRPEEKYLADLAGLARRKLAALGVGAVFGNDGTPGWCTVGNPGRFFSHRRDAGALGSSGRMATCVWME